MKTLRYFLRFVLGWRPRFNHFCPGDSGAGEWCHRSAVPSICGYCRRPNAALLAERRHRQNTIRVSSGPR